MPLKEFLSRPLFGGSLDDNESGLSLKRLAVPLAVVLLLGGAAVFGLYSYVSSVDTWKATVVGVGKGTVSFVFEDDAEECELATCPDGIVVEEGDTVLIRIDEETGNRVVEVLDD